MRSTSMSRVNDQSFLQMQSTSGYSIQSS